MDMSNFTCIQMMDTEMINDFTEHQLSVWPEAYRNFEALSGIGRKRIRLGDFEAFAQHNPARIISTAAKTDADTIRQRPCFLCRGNRPEQQFAITFIPEWELLLNPFPILPIHFTIADTIHRPQDRIPLEMASMAEKAPDLAIFFNGATAGASAPDHRHCQAVLKSELPLVRVGEKFHSPGMPPIVSSESFGADLPFHFVSGIIYPGKEGMQALSVMTQICGIDRETGRRDPNLVNAFFWMDEHSLLRVIVIPRTAHRPECFYREDDKKMTVSPGALDMAGIIVLPRKEDFDIITPDKMREIYSQVAFSDSLPDNIFPNKHYS